jgi:hypothetical protein
VSLCDIEWGKKIAPLSASLWLSLGSLRCMWSCNYVMSRLLSFFQVRLALSRFNSPYCSFDETGMAGYSFSHGTIHACHFHDGNRTADR